MIPLTDSGISSSESSINSAKSQNAPIRKSRSLADLPSKGSINGSLDSLSSDTQLNNVFPSFSILHMRSFSVNQLYRKKLFKIGDKVSPPSLQPIKKRAVGIRDILVNHHQSFSLLVSSFVDTCKGSDFITSKQRKMKACELQDILKNMHGAIMVFISLIRDYLSVEELEQHAMLLQAYQDTILWVFYGSHGNDLDRMEEGIHVMDTDLTHMLGLWDIMERQLLIRPTDGFRIEGTDLSLQNRIQRYTKTSSDPWKSSNTYTNYQMEHIQMDAFLFREAFKNQHYKLFMGFSDEEAVILCLLETPSKCIAVIRRKYEVDQVVTVDHDPTSKKSPRALIQSILPDLDFSRLKKVHRDEEVERNLIALDELRSSTRYKIGVFYVQAGQKTETEYLRNQAESFAFDSFLSCLGERISLLGFKGYNGGLDTTGNKTGTTSIYTQWRNFEIMYHVAPLLPFRSNDVQQLERKRHIGNDVVNIVFLEKDAQFDPSTIKSNFTHVFLIVQETKEDANGNKGYVLSTASNQEVPTFGPTLPEKGYFGNRYDFRDFLMAKMINAENAAYKAPSFSKLHKKARKTMFESLLKDSHISSNGHKPAKHKHQLISGVKRLFSSKKKISGSESNSSSVTDMLGEALKSRDSIFRKKPSVIRQHKDHGP